MSIVQGPQSRGTTGGSSHSHTTPLPFANEFTKTLTRSSARFGALSHHSFFSRHNPHPNRVRHIQGERGKKIDFVLVYRLKTMAFVTVFQEIPEEECVRRQTQYSAETGRILPPPTKSYQRRSHSQRQIHPQPFHDQELMVLELLCQILQTDSLSTVQQWLLLAGQREKELVMGMIRRALDGVDVSGHHQTNLQQLQALHPGASPPAYGPSFQQPWRKPPRTRSGGRHQMKWPAGVNGFNIFTHLHSSLGMDRTFSDDKPGN
uniref:Thymus, brain and testes associated n=1 Tax=Scophthalmus maximus TaxID=52904 RepID=A0A8D2ZJ19_SCOMX